MTENAPQNGNTNQVGQAGADQQDLHSIEAEVAAAQAELDAARAKLEEMKANRDAQESAQYEAFAQGQDASAVTEGVVTAQVNAGQGYPVPPPPSEAVEAVNGFVPPSDQNVPLAGHVSTAQAAQPQSQQMPPPYQSDYFWQQPPVQEQSQGQQYYTPPQDQQSGYYQAQPPNPYQAASSSKEHVVAGLLGIFLGGLGIHKFYLGYYDSAIIMLAVSIIGGLITGGLAFFVVWVIGVIEGILYLTKSQPEFEQTYVFSKRLWF